MNNFLQNYPSITFGVFYCIPIPFAIATKRRSLYIAKDQRLAVIVKLTLRKLVSRMLHQIFQHDSFTREMFLAVLAGIDMKIGFKGHRKS